MQKKFEHPNLLNAWAYKLRFIAYVDVRGSMIHSLKKLERADQEKIITEVHIVKEVMANNLNRSGGSGSANSSSLCEKYALAHDATRLAMAKTASIGPEMSRDCFKWNNNIFFLQLTSLLGLPNRIHMWTFKMNWKMPSKALKKAVSQVLFMTLSRCRWFLPSSGSMDASSHKFFRLLKTRINYVKKVCQEELKMKTCQCSTMTI